MNNSARKQKRWRPRFSVMTLLVLVTLVWDVVVFRRRKDHELAKQVVRSVVHDWDPYGLLALGCPDDEFDREIAKLARLTKRIRNRDDAICAVSRVFTRAFSLDHFTHEACHKVGTFRFDDQGRVSQLAE